MAAFEDFGGCPRCGIVGIHGCTGRPIPAPTPGDEARLSAALIKAFGPFASDVRETAETEIKGGLR